MTNKPKILSNNLAPKVGDAYENELNNPEVHNQIIEAFDKNLYNENFEENLNNLSSDQLKNINLDTLQSFVNQREVEYKKDYSEFRKYYDYFVENINSHTFNEENNFKNMMDKLNEMHQNYKLYIAWRDSLHELPEDFKNTWILASDKVHRQYEFIRKIDHTPEDFTKLWYQDEFGIFVFGLGGSRLLNWGNDRMGKTPTAKNLENVLIEIKGEIDEDCKRRLESNSKKNDLYSKNIKLVFIRYFIGLKYLLAAAEKYNDTKNIAMIQETIDYTLDAIKILDNFIKDFSINKTENLGNSIK